MLRIRKAGGSELSAGTMDNPAFADARPEEDGVQAEANDIALLEVYCDEGESFTDVTVPGVPELRYRVSDGEWLAPGADAEIGTVTPSGVALAVRVHLAADPAPSLPRATGVLGPPIIEPTASGSVDVVVTLSGYSYAIPQPSGSLFSPITVHGHAVAEESGLDPIPTGTYHLNGVIAEEHHGVWTAAQPTSTEFAWFGEDWFESGNLPVRVRIGGGPWTATQQTHDLALLSFSPAVEDGATTVTLNRPGYYDDIVISLPEGSCFATGQIVAVEGGFSTGADDEYKWVLIRQHVDDTSGWQAPRRLKLLVS